MPEVQGGENLLFLTDEQLQPGHRGDVLRLSRLYSGPGPDPCDNGLWTGTSPALHFIARGPGTTVNNLLGILGVTKQSLNRVLRTLIADGLVESRIGATDKRERQPLSDGGWRKALERRLSDAQRARMRDAYREAGPDAGWPGSARFWRQ